MSHGETRKGNISVFQVASFETSAISPETMRVFNWVVFSVVCQMINIFGIATNVINIVCFVRQGFKDSVNVSLLGLYKDF